MNDSPVSRPDTRLPDNPGTAAAERSSGPRLGPSPFGHRSLAEDLQGIVQERPVRSTKSPRPGVGIRAATDPNVVSSPRVFSSPRVLMSPRVFLDPRCTTTIRATEPPR